MTNAATPVSNGIFITTIDFGNVFTGSNYWLNIAVRTNGAGAFTPLSPRQILTSAPYSVRALSAAAADAATVAATVASNSVSATNIASGQVVKSINGLTDAVTLAPGANVSFVTNSNTVLINLSANVPQLSSPVETWNVSGTNIFGSIVASNANTYNVPLQIYTNLGATTGNDPMISMGTLSSPAMAQIDLSPGHGGLGDGSEVTFQFNQLAIIGNGNFGYSGRIQLGSHAGGPYSITFLDTGESSAGTPFPVNAGGSGSFPIYKYTYWNGSSEVRPEIAQRISSVNTTTFNGTFTTYDSWNNPGFDNANPETSGVTHRQDIITGVGVKNYGATMIDATSTIANGTYNINLGQSYQDIYLTGPLTVSMTNLSAITNTAVNTITTLRSRSVFYGGSVSNAFTLAPGNNINLLWANGPAPTYIPASNVLILDIDYSVSGGQTNALIFANLATSGFTPYIDPSAQAYFTAAGITDPVNKAMWNYLVIQLKANNLWTNQWDGIWPLSIGTNTTIAGMTNCMSWNLVNPGVYRATFITNGDVWSGTHSFTANGFTSDGTNIWMDTGFNPSTAASPHYQSNNATVLFYNQTATPTIGSYFACFCGALGASAPHNVFFCITADSSGHFGAQGLNVNAGEGATALGAPTNGVIAYTITPATAGLFNNGTQEVVGTGGTNVPGVDFFVGARNGGGSGDHPVGATFGLVMIGGGITEAQYYTLTNIINTTMAIGNRQ